MNAIYYHIMHQTTRHDLMWIYRNCPFTLIFIVHTVSANLAVTNYQVQGETIKIYVHIQMGTEQIATSTLVTRAGTLRKEKRKIKIVVIINSVWRPGWVPSFVSERPSERGCSF